MASRSAPITGTFALTDHFERRVSNATYAGRYMLIFFGFTRCRVVCPRALTRIEEALDSLGDSAKKIQPLYISVDPERDTPDIMAAFLANRRHGFVGLTGDQSAIDAAKHAFAVFSRRASDSDDPEGYAMPHTAFTYLLDRDGGYLTHFPDAISAEVMAERLGELVQ